MAYDIESAKIFRGHTGAQGNYAINDRFSELNQKMDSKINIQDFDKVATELKSDIKSIGDKLENDIKDYNLTTIREMNSCLETISKNFSNAINRVRHDLEEHVKFVDQCKKEQEEFNKDVVNTVGSIYKAFKVVAFIFGLNMASILAIVIYLCTM